MKNWFKITYILISKSRNAQFSNGLQGVFHWLFRFPLNMVPILSKPFIESSSEETIFFDKLTISWPHTLVIWGLAHLVLQVPNLDRKNIFEKRIIFLFSTGLMVNLQAAITWSRILAISLSSISVAFTFSISSSDISGSLHLDSQATVSFLFNFFRQGAFFFIPEKLFTSFDLCGSPNTKST